MGSGTGSYTDIIISTEQNRCNHLTCYDDKKCVHNDVNVKKYCRQEKFK